MKIFLIIILLFDFYSSSHGLLSQPIDLSTCGHDKNCFYDPDTCQLSKDIFNCAYAVTWHNKNEYIEFELCGTLHFNPGYMSIGFSKSKEMGSAYSSICCQVQGNGGEVSIAAYYGQIGVSNKKFNYDEGFLIAKDSTNYLGGNVSSNFIQCRFRRKILPTSNENVLYNFANYTYFVIVERNNGEGDVLLSQVFEGGRMISESDYTMDEGISSSLAALTSRNLDKAHGFFMIFANTVFTSLGSLIARHYKLHKIGNNNLYSYRSWLFIHIVSHLLAVLFFILGIILVFISAGVIYMNKTYPLQLHPILGLCVFSLHIINFLFAWLRPAETHRWRYIFNWVHYALFNVAFFLAVPTMFIGLRTLEVGTGTPSSIFTYSILCAPFCIHITLDVALEFAQHYFVQRNYQRKFHMSERATRNGYEEIHSTYVPCQEQIKLDYFRTWAFGGHAALTFICAFYVSYNIITM